MSTSSLHEQNVVYSQPKIKTQYSLLATAIVDALGAPPEFHTRFTFPLVDEMTENLNFTKKNGDRLEKGVWTDDTSMTLCLANSIVSYPSKDGFNEADQLERYARWAQNGELSAVDECFDIGNTIARAVNIWATITANNATTTPSDPKFDKRRQAAVKEVAKSLSKPVFSGNGSLMRVLPIGLAYYPLPDDQIAQFARRSSLPTHPNQMCQEACEVWTGAIVRVIRAAASSTKLTKLDLLQYFANFQYTQDGLQNELTIPSQAPPPPTSPSQLEEYYWSYHPLLLKIKNSPKQLVPGSETLALPSPETLSSSGYVLNTLVCALYCFLATKTFEEGAIMVVNMGSDADTVGAVYGGLAGCWYASSEDRDGLFWSDRVRRWESTVVKKDLIRGIADELIKLSERLKQS
ncbi:hypothetical protein ONZ45_g6714 [Pleurotus djamor]|nr:hypothetical protein ONZ45_g6714 [Pleurotus djamor]